MKNDTKKALIICGCIFALSFAFYYLMCRNRAYTKFGFLMEEVYTATYLEEKIGDIEKVSFPNYFIYNGSYKNTSCLELNVRTNKGKTKVCAIIQNSQDSNTFTTVGYVINDEDVIFNLPKFNVENYEEQINNFEHKKLNFNTSDYFDMINGVKEYLENDNGSLIVYYDEINNTWMYETSLYNYETKGTEKIRVVNKKAYLIISRNSNLIAYWEEEIKKD